MIQAGRRQFAIRGLENIGHVPLQCQRQGRAFVARRVVRHRCGGGLCERRVEAQFGIDQIRPDDFLRIQGRQPARQVFQLADIARPAIALQPLERPHVHLFLRQSLAGCQREKMPGQVGNILGALAQRRQAQRHDIEAEKQILAKQSLLDRDPQILVGGRHNAHIGLDRHTPADGGIFALLEHPQQPRLRIHRHVADLVEKQGAALGLLEAPG